MALVKLVVEVIPFAEWTHQNDRIQKDIGQFLERFGQLSIEGSKQTVECQGHFDYEGLARFLNQKYGGYCEVRTHCRE